MVGFVTTEFQSQLLERWLSTDEVIDNYLLHAETGKPMPDELVAKIKNTATFNQGFPTTEYLASALIDMKIHLADPTGMDVGAFEKETLAELNMPKSFPCGTARLILGTCSLERVMPLPIMAIYVGRRSDCRCFRSFRPITGRLL